MLRTLLLALAVGAVGMAGGVFAAPDDDRKDTNSTQPAQVTITKVDPRKGTITVRSTDAQGKAQEKTFQLTKDVRLLDETGRVVNLATFESGNEAIVIESAGKLRELRRAAHRGRERRLSDAVRTLIEMTDCDEGCTEDLQIIYDMLRKLDTGKNGKIDPKALKTEADNILRERVQEVFQQLDTNKDGKISKEEARGLIKEHFDRIDTNKDGFIEFDELLKAAKARRDQGPAANKANGREAPKKERK